MPSRKTNNIINEVKEFAESVSDTELLYLDKLLASWVKYSKSMRDPYKRIGYLCDTLSRFLGKNADLVIKLINDPDILKELIDRGMLEEKDKKIVLLRYILSKYHPLINSTHIETVVKVDLIRPDEVEIRFDERMDDILVIGEKALVTLLPYIENNPRNVILRLSIPVMKKIFEEYGHAIISLMEKSSSKDVTK